MIYCKIKSSLLESVENISTSWTEIVNISLTLRIIPLAAMLLAGCSNTASRQQVKPLHSANVTAAGRAGARG